MFCLSVGKNFSNKLDVRRNSQAPLAKSIAHYLLITRNLNGARERHSKDAFMFY